MVNTSAFYKKSADEKEEVVSKVLAQSMKPAQTEKPVELLRALIQICPRGGTVIDCFMGSGSTGVACVQEGRNFIGIELGDQYFETASRRIQEAQDEILDDF